VRPGATSTWFEIGNRRLRHEGAQHPKGTRRPYSPSELGLRFLLESGQNIEVFDVLDVRVAKD
jgi:hypothetical protein